MQSEPASHADIVELLGDIDELIIERIIDTGATVAEVAAAIDALEAQRTLGEQPISASARVIEVQKILEEMTPEDDDDPTPGAFGQARSIEGR